MIFWKRIPTNLRFYLQWPSWTMQSNLPSMTQIVSVQTLVQRTEMGSFSHLQSSKKFQLRGKCLHTSILHMYSKPRISRIQVDRQIYPSYAKIQLMRSEIKRFGTIVREILSVVCEDPTYASSAILTYVATLAWPQGPALLGAPRFCRLHFQNLLCYRWKHKR